MIKITLGVEGMVCGMCESHVNDALRRAFPLRKVKSSRKKKETIMMVEEDIEDAKIEAVIQATGYQLTSIHKESY